MYDIDENTNNEIQRRFTYHPPRPDQVPRYEGIRAKALEFAEFICKRVPPSIERTVALARIDEAVMAANAGIARNEPAAAEPPTTPDADETK